MWRRYLDVPLLLIIALSGGGIVLSFVKGSAQAADLFGWLFSITFLLLGAIHYELVIAIIMRLYLAYSDRKRRRLESQRQIDAESEERRQRVLADFRNQAVLRLQERASPDLMYGLHPVEFERFVLDYFRLLGFYAEETKRSGDGGIDGYLRLGNAVYFLQCKRYDKGSKVGEPELRDLLGAVTKASAKGGIFVTTASYSNKALSFASGTVLELIDGEELANRIKALEVIDPAERGGKATPRAAKLA